MSRAKELLYLSYYITDTRTNEQTNYSSPFLHELGGSEIVEKSQVWEVEVSSTSSSKGESSTTSGTSGTTSTTSTTSSKAKIITGSGGGNGNGNGNGQVK